MLIPEDVPAPWHPVMVDGHSTLPIDESDHLEDALGLTTTSDERADVSWDVIEHEGTGARAALRMIAVRSNGQPIAALVSGICTLPRSSTAELILSELRTIPIEEIQVRASLRWAQMGTILAGLTGSEDPQTVHLASVSARWLELWGQGDRDPKSAIADEMGRSVQTVRRWVREAREAGLLPRETKHKPGRRPQRDR